MTRGEKWKRFFHEKNWISNDVISGGENEILKIVIPRTSCMDDSKIDSIDSALIMGDLDILCFESRTGTVFFQWDDIIQVKVVEDKKKRKWL